MTMIFITQPPCEMKTFRLSSDVFPYALAVRKRSPLGARLSAAIMELRHSGELQEIYKHSVYDPRVCFEDWQDGGCPAATHAQQS